MAKKIRYFSTKERLDKFKIDYTVVEFDKRTGLTETYYMVDLSTVTEEQLKKLNEN